ncbi:MAG: peptide deformylase [Firmicutes bacterium]|nr:peptide deformylase [Bacillota bacterium]
MAIRKILKGDDVTLQKNSRPVEKFDQRLWQLLDDMAQTMHAANGCGLAAVQVGVLRRAVVIDTGDGVLELVNPEIIGQEGTQREQEGCLSFPEEYGVTLRPAVVKLKAQNRAGKWCFYKADGLKARAFCHECDHLNGIVFKERWIKEL